ncbi:MAG: hypothetical protein DRP42_01935 [Tenericutes bacterium]|nr:MAG: hypothetical protein DRP42_01935 [Mycoplasmatota bacterium]
MNTIDSTTNQHVKHLSKLSNKSAIESQKRFLVEGFHLVDEAFKAGILQEILVFEKQKYDVEQTLVSPMVMKKLSFNKSNPGIIGVCKYVEPKADITTMQKVIVLDSVNNPGNLGAIIRSARSFSFDAVLLLNESVFAHNDKVIKSAQGTNFNFPVVKVTPEELKIFNTYNFVLGDKTTDMENVEFKKPFALVFGNESKGIAPATLKTIGGQSIKIDIKETESLNLSVAASIAMFHGK